MKIEVTLGIDIGGTNTAFGFVDKEGNCIASSSIPTNAHEGAPKLFERLSGSIKELFSPESDKYELIGIGIGAPNANYYKGTVELPPNLKWGVVNIIDIVHQYFDIPAAITNDANAAAIGEMQFGAAKGMKDFIVITLGTGVGSGIVANGDLIYGHDGFAGELGHAIYDIDGRLCGCGRKGCLETYASATGIVRTIKELLKKTGKESVLADVPEEKITAKMIYDAAQSGDEIALEAFEFTGKVLGKMLADFMTFSSPEAFILFGGLANAGDFIFKPTHKYMEQYMLNIFKNKVKLIPSALTKGNTAVLGASALIWNELDKMQKAAR